MESVSQDCTKLEGRAVYTKVLSEIDKMIASAEDCKQQLETRPVQRSIALAKLQNNLNKSFTKINDDFKPVDSASKSFTKTLDKHFRGKPIPDSESDFIAPFPGYINRAIVMHLLREGRFSAAETFIAEVNARPPHKVPEPRFGRWNYLDETGSTPPPRMKQDILATIEYWVEIRDRASDLAWQRDFANDGAGCSGGGGRSLETATLQRRFADMYHILDMMRVGNLQPAVDWAREHADDLHARGSNLLFELCRLQFITYFMGGGDDNDGDTPMIDALDSSSGNPSYYDRLSKQQSPSVSSGPIRAYQYARATFGSFASKYKRDIQRLMGAFAYHPNISESPYGMLFATAAPDGGNESGAGAALHAHGGVPAAWRDAAAHFTREFCSLLGLSAQSPLYISATAGGIALPMLLKVRVVMREKRTEWTSRDELPIEVPLPPDFHFHSIFVCPVSKEQSTDRNPPMMMPCGHVICKESLQRISKGARFKCPYCPSESHPRDAMVVYF
ncbi:CTLH/CRA C-terminal to lish motif domain-containing protein [Lineolata rhizophorae]|uniref:GID complex catalytic subunit 2 n=1 Tax=Lineolata rhizophorae TaxID=578093 RepID=A0A6A6NT65_9PEZI|nr:CTLH/CRA C-terminal to lish motif domain-containing protein [Lineolata rhizophorae]